MFCCEPVKLTAVVYLTYVRLAGLLIVSGKIDSVLAASSLIL